MPIGLLRRSAGLATWTLSPAISTLSRNRWRGISVQACASLRPAWENHIAACRWRHVAACRCIPGSGRDYEPGHRDRDWLNANAHRSLEDLIARAVRLLLDLAAGIPAPAKHARDYLRMAALVDPMQVDAAWQDQRRPTQPTTFPEAATLVRDLILTRSNLLITPEYSNTATACPRCVPSPPFQLAARN